MGIAKEHHILHRKRAGKVETYNINVDVSHGGVLYQDLEVWHWRLRKGTKTIADSGPDIPGYPDEKAAREAYEDWQARRLADEKDGSGESVDEQLGKKKKRRKR